MQYLIHYWQPCFVLSMYPFRQFIVGMSVILCKFKNQYLTELDIVKIDKKSPILWIENKITYHLVPITNHLLVIHRNYTEETTVEKLLNYFEMLPHHSLQ